MIVWLKWLILHCSLDKLYWKMHWLIFFLNIQSSSHSCQFHSDGYSILAVEWNIIPALLTVSHGGDWGGFLSRFTPRMERIGIYGLAVWTRSKCTLIFLLIFYHVSLIGLYEMNSKLTIESSILSSTASHHINSCFCSLMAYKLRYYLSFAFYFQQGFEFLS